jgi:hypothetical protein
LPDEVSLLLQKVIDLKATIYAGQLTFFSVPLGQGAQFFKEGWGAVPETAIKQLREEATILLRPIAQFEGKGP